MVLACRNMEKGRAALAEVEAAASRPKPELEELDLASLSSVRSFAARFEAKHDGLDLLINNAGVMAARGGSPTTASSSTWGRTTSVTSRWRTCSCP